MKFLKGKNICILLSCILILSIVIALYFSLDYFITENTPAWIQAVGSIAAIFAAALISKNQYKNERRLDSERAAKSEINKFMVIKALMARSHTLSKDITESFSTQKDEDFSKVTPVLMTDTCKVLMALPTFDIPHGFLALDVITVGRGLDVLAENWEGFCNAVAADENNSIDVPEAEPLLELAEEIRLISGEAINICTTEISQRELITGTNTGWGSQSG